MILKTKMGRPEVSSLLELCSCLPNLGMPNVDYSSQQFKAKFSLKLFNCSCPRSCSHVSLKKKKPIEVTFLQFGVTECFNFSGSMWKLEAGIAPVSSAYLQLLWCHFCLPHIASHLPGAFLEFLFIFSRLVSYPLHACD